MAWGKHKDEKEYNEEMRKAEEDRLLDAIKENEDLQKAIGEIAVIATSPYLTQIHKKIEEMENALLDTPQQKPVRRMPPTPRPDDDLEEDFEEEDQSDLEEEYQKKKALWLKTKNELSELKKKLSL